MLMQIEIQPGMFVNWAKVYRLDILPNPEGVRCVIVYFDKHDQPFSFGAITEEQEKYVRDQLFGINQRNGAGFNA